MISLSVEEPKSLKVNSGTSLVVHWLRLRLPMHAVQVPSLVRKLGSHCLAAKEPKHKKQKQYCNKFNIVNKFNKSKK